MAKRKPTRRDLLIVIGRLQGMAGAVKGAANDRNPNRAAELEALADRMCDLAIDARGFDPMIEESGPWADRDGGDDKAWRRR